MARKPVSVSAKSASARAPAGRPSPPRKTAPRYDYDGLSGLFLRMPWWGHLLAAAAMYPLCVMALPRLPVREAWVQPLLHEWLPHYWMLPASAFVFGALLSLMKARALAAKPGRGARGRAPARKTAAARHAHACKVAAAAEQERA